LTEGPNGFLLGVLVTVLELPQPPRLSDSVPCHNAES
jgi:hypothetical protein